MKILSVHDLIAIFWQANGFDSRHDVKPSQWRPDVICFAALIRGGRTVDQNIIKHLQAEEAELVRKLNAIRGVLLVYGLGAKAQHLVPQPAPEKRAPANDEECSSRPRLPLDRFSGYGAAVIRTAKMCINDFDQPPVPTRLLVKLIEQRGLKVRGEDKVNALSALLARSIDVNSNGRRGWTISADSGDADAASSENEMSHGKAGDISDAEVKGGDTPFDLSLQHIPSGSTR